MEVSVYTKDSLELWHNFEDYSNSWEPFKNYRSKCQLTDFSKTSTSRWLLRAARWRAVNPSSFRSLIDSPGGRFGMIILVALCDYGQWCNMWAVVTLGYHGEHVKSVIIHQWHVKLWVEQQLYLVVPLLWNCIVKGRVFFRILHNKATAIMHDQKHYTAIAQLHPLHTYREVWQLFFNNTLMWPLLMAACRGVWCRQLRTLR